MPLLRLLRDAWTTTPSTRLHRWCLRTSDVYKNTCVWERKADAATADNGCHEEGRSGGGGGESQPAAARRKLADARR